MPNLMSINAFPRKSTLWYTWDYLNLFISVESKFVTDYVFNFRDGNVEIFF